MDSRKYRAAAREHALYAVIDPHSGHLHSVSVWPHGHGMVEVIRLNKAQADVYVAGGCPALAASLGLVVRSPSE